MKRLFTYLLLFISLIGNTTTYFFSNAGNDGAAGTSSGTAWATLTKFNSFFSSFQPGDIVSFRRGDTFLGFMTISRSGSSGNPITITAYGSGAKPIISGFYTIPSWTSIGGGLYQANIPAALSTLNMVTLNGAFQAIGRWPKVIAANKGYLAYQSSTGATSITSNAIGSALSYVGGQVVIRTSHWVIAKGTITAQSSNVVTYSSIGGNPQNAGPSGYGFFFQNHNNACTVLGDWSYNGTTHNFVMYFGGGGPGANVVQVSSINNLVTANSVSWITFDNVALTGSNTRTITMTSSNNIQINNCDISYSGADGVWTNASSTIRIEGSTIIYSNSNGITGNSSSSFTIRSNTFTNSGMVAGMGDPPIGANGGNSYQATSNIGANSTIEFNTITASGYLGIHFSGGNNLIQKNFLNYHCMVKDDGGAIYSWNSATAGTRILDNIVLNSYGAPEGTSDNQASGFGIYLDDDSPGVEIARNTTAGCGYSGIYIHNSPNTNIHDNTLYNNGTQVVRPQILYGNDRTLITGTSFNGNIAFARNTNTQILVDVGQSNTSSAAPLFSSANNNYYCAPFHENETGTIRSPFSLDLNSGFVHTNLVGWRSQTGREQNSLQTPIAVTDSNKIRFEYNATNAAVVVPLAANYMDVRGVVYIGSITLQPWTSAVLLQTTSGNSLPVVTAGPDQTITLPTNQVTMAGTTTDPDGSIVSRTWTKLVGGAATITTPGSNTTTITGLVQGGYQFQLCATDNSGGTSCDVMSVTVNPAPNQLPTSNAGTDKNITLPTNSVTQVGSGSDPDGTISGYLWTKTAGPATFNIVSASSATTVINNLVQGTYTFNLRVTDNVGATANDQVTIVVNPAVNQPPISNAGPNQAITLPTSSVTMAGSGSDADGTISSYLWTKTAGPATFNIVTPTSATTVINNLVAGTYTFNLQVTDNQGATANDQMTVLVNPAPPVNQPPIANAGTDKNITLPTNSVNQVGSGSDADGTVTGYLWTKTAGPATFTIVSPTASTTVINNLVQGTYTFQLQVTDNQGATGADQMTIIVNAAPNTPPVAGAGPDQVITLPTTTTAMAGTATDPGGSIASTVWSQIGGTASTITNVNSLTTSITGLSTAGSRTYRLLVTDNLGLTDDDTVIILVNPAPNQPPVSNAGTDKNITLPTNSVTQVGSASDPDGTVAGVLWTKASGPASSNIVSATQTTTVINNLVQGTYIFNLRVTDNSGAITNDQMTIVVNPAVNQPPISNAGPNQAITLPTNSVTMAGSGTDADGTISSYLWTKTGGPATFNIVTPTSATTVINNLVAGTYTFNLQVTDNQGATANDQITVLVNPAPNQPPISNAGPNQAITLPTSSVTMAGSGSDPDGTIASYLWTKTAGPATFNIVTPTSATTVINNLVAGTYTFNLQVTDNLGLTANDQMTVLVNPAPPVNQPPIANAGTDKNITLPTNSINQVGSGTDADGTVTGYLWTKISGPATFNIVSPTAATTVINNLVQGTYVFQLQVTDNLGLTATDQMSVIVNAAPIVPPIANAGTDKNITLPTNSINQVGSGSDADGTVVGYLWTKISGPATFNIVSPTQSTTVINNLVQGTYVFQLQVTDNVGATGTDQMSVIVNAAPNTPPVVSAGPDQVITLPTTTATMAGTASDPGGSVASTTWSQIGGTASTITNSSSLTTTITGLSTAGSRTYKLLVTDNLGATTSDTMIILVNPSPNLPPVVSAGADILDSTLSTSITLTGSVSDPDGTITGILWTKVSGPTVTITSATQAVTTITNFVAGVYVFRLRGTDNSGATTSDDVTVTIIAYIPPPPQPTAPTANAGPDYRPIICVFCSQTSVTVTGVGTDGTGVIVSYLWTQVSGPTTANINSPNTAQTIISNLRRGTYVFSFRVADGGGLSGTDTMTIYVRKNHLVFKNGKIVVQAW